jgi:heme-degrading monooxygenase HmoA
MVITRWQDKAAFNSWVHSDAFKKAHGRGGCARQVPRQGTRAPARSPTSPWILRNISRYCFSSRTPTSS